MNPLIRTLARLHGWKRLLEEGEHRSADELAAAGGITQSFVNRLLRLTLLAPDIVEAILGGAAAEGDAAGRADAADAEELSRTDMSGDFWHSCGKTRGTRSNRRG